MSNVKIAANSPLGIIAGLQPRSDGAALDSPSDNQSITGSTLSVELAPVNHVQSERGLRFYLQSLARDLLPAERVTKCLRAVIPGKSMVEILHSAAFHAASYKNLQTCASPWGCPVCAAKIGERRRVDLTQALAYSKLYPVMITYTLRHNAGDKTKYLLEALKEALVDLKGGHFSEYRALIGWIGSVSSLEITYGTHGPHPHRHEIVLFAEPPDLDLLAVEMKTRWIAVLARQGYDASWEHGVDVRDGDRDVFDYVAKYGRLPKDVSWTIAHELTKANQKKASLDGRSPLRLLVDYGEGDQRAGELFQEYFAAFKGSHPLQWSKGLRKLLALGVEQSDKELVEEAREDAILLACLTRQQWRVILGNDARAELLDVASAGNVEVLREWLTGFGIYL